MRRIPLLAVAVAALVSAGPASSQEPVMSCTAREARAFDFWVGEWDVVNRARTPNEEALRETGLATDRVYTVAGGCGIVEHWRGDTHAGFVVGFSLRAWDPEAERWDLVLLWPVVAAPGFFELHGGFEDGVGRFDREARTAEGDTIVVRYTFDEIESDSFRWSYALSRDRGRTWSDPPWVMEFTRRDPIRDPGLWNGLGGGTERCPGEERRVYDDALGEWRGWRASADGDTVDVRARIVGTLEGCAVMDRIESLDDRWESFGIRAYAPGAGTWVAYGIDTATAAIERWESAPDASPYALVARSDPDRRVRWMMGPDTIRIVEERAGPSGTWDTVSEIRLTERVGPSPD